ncbi:MAG: mannose-1-phosphate guanylyltransferase [Candidatus Promineifilaceae bacterium]|nr:mannose-1-phosphate guanylyltransferase [Candidatus Promineifilaceae bacterium]
MIYPVIMAGGTGTRLWPLSRRSFPKQALELVGGRTLIQHAIDRLLPDFAAEHIFIITRQEHVPPLSAQVPELPAENFIVEPEGRGTASAVGLAAIHLHHRDPQATMAVLTADHYITDTSRFRQALRAADDIAQENYLVTLGIKPTFPSTGFGYIQQGEPLPINIDMSAYRAQRFIEKPELTAAQSMFKSGEYSWNSGMFIWRIEQILTEFERQMPNLYQKLQAVESILDQPNYKQELSQIWPTVNKETIDYGIMENAKDVAVIPVDIGWSDVGSWASLLDVLPADDQGNIVIGDHIGIDTQDTLIVGGKRLITSIGLSDLVIVDTEDALLICSKDREQDVRAMVGLLEKHGRGDLL